MMRNDHLTVEEINIYLDTSDLSEEYLLRMEEITMHLSSCNLCQRILRKALVIESICEEGGLAAGLRLLPKEEKVRRDVQIRDWEMQQALQPAAYVNGFSNNHDYNNQDYLRRFAFSMANLRRAAAVVRGSDEEDRRNTADLNVGQPIIPEISGDKLVVRVAGELVWEQLGNTVRQFNVVLCPEGASPIEKAAIWHESGRYFAAEFDVGEAGEEFQIYIHEIDRKPTR